MSNTLRDQLSAIPVKRLTTVLRIDLSLRNSDESLDGAHSLIDIWWREKATSHGLVFDKQQSSHSLANERCRVEARAQDGAFAFALEEIEPLQTEPRDWITDVALTSKGGSARLGMRLSYRQPHNWQRVPEPRAPSFLRKIVDLGNAVDDWPLVSAAHRIGREEFPAFRELFYSTRRTLPLLVVSEDWRTDSVYVKEETLAKLLAGAAHVVRLGAEASWLLSEEVGKDWSTFQGAVRCYNPQPDIGADKYKHRLWLADAIQRIDASGKDAFLNACVRHVFTQVNANFESEALLTPATLRRRLEEVTIPESQPQPSPDPKADFDDLAPSAPGPTTSETNALPSLQEVEAARALQQEQTDKLLRLVGRVDQLEQSSLMLERDLQEERAAHATTKKNWEDDRGKWEEDRSLLQMYEQDENRHDKLSRLLNKDVSRESSEVLKLLWLSLGPFLNSIFSTADHLRSVEQDLASERTTREEAENAFGQQTGKLLALEGRLQNEDSEGPAWIIELLPRLVSSNPSLSDSLRTLEECFSDRIVVLETARKSASDSSQFLHGSQAFGLLWALATDYWMCLQEGGSDVDAKSVFGKCYAAKDKTNLSKGGKKRRTFQYAGQSVLMEKHLKIGAADNASDTLRVHFEWIADEKRIVIGHCGCHLDF